MNKTIVIILFFVSLLMLSCSDDDEIRYNRENLYLDYPVDIYSFLNKDTLRILDVGNSYSQDYSELLPLILKSSGVNMSRVCYYRMAIPGAGFKTWYNQYYHGKEDLNAVRIAGGLKQSLPDSSLVSFRNVLSVPWDIIIIHPVSTYSNDYSLWNTHKPGGYLYDLTMLLRTEQPNAVLAFELVHSYWSGYKSNTEHSSLDRWKNIARATETMANDYPVIQMIIPCGTAIQNLRGTSYCTEHELTRDGTHLALGLARYTAACCLYQKLFYPRCKVSLYDIPFSYSCSPEDVSGIKYKDGSIDVNEANRIVAIQSAIAACDNSYGVLTW